MVVLIEDAADPPVWKRIGRAVPVPPKVESMTIWELTLLIPIRS